MIPAPVNEAAPVAADTELFPASETATDTTAANEAAVTSSGLNNTTIIAGLIGILALIALGLVGLMSRRRRSAFKDRRVAVTPSVVRPQVATATVPAATPVRAAVDPELAMMADPVIAQSVRTPAPAVVRAENSFGAQRSQGSMARTPGMLASNGAAVDLPARAPATYEERDALMKRMIAAKPDKANPFTDRKARTKRARLIVQSLDRDFAHTDPWIDLSQYPNNWPELARRRFPQAA